MACVNEKFNYVFYRKPSLFLDTSSESPYVYFPILITIILEVINIFKSHTRLQCQCNFFSNRMINDWNNLPTDIVNAGSLNTFKTLLDSHLSINRFIFV